MKLIKLNLQKGAMFGLDARIALAIFGALSVISGAALYSAIQNAKTEQARQYMEEMIKASEQYYLDNFKQVPVYSALYSNLYISDLLENRTNLNTWKGPYVSANFSSNRSITDNFTSFLGASVNTRLYLRVKDTWTEMNDTDQDEKCSSGSSNCVQWITIDAGSSNSKNNVFNLFTKLDDLVDNGDGALSGKVRYNTSGNGYLMYMSIKYNF
jgi:type II secretory pathway pseudopilin PulG